MQVRRKVGRLLVVVKANDDEDLQLGQDVGGTSKRHYQGGT